jgi:tetratricopeptide (TPR) repeat protein
MAGIHSMMPPADAFLRARADAKQASELAPELAEAITSEAWVKLCFDRDFKGAREGFDTALRLRPDYPFAHNGLGLLHIALGRPEEAVRNLIRAWGLHATAPFLNALLADSYYLAREYDKAAERGLAALATEPGYPLAHACLGRTFLQQGKLAEAIWHLEQSRELSHKSPVMSGFLACAYAKAGKTADSECILRELHDRRDVQKQYVPVFFLGLVFLALGRHDSAFDHFEQALQERTHWVLFLETDPLFDPLRSHPRFPGLLAEMGRSL